MRAILQRLVPPLLIATDRGFLAVLGVIGATYVVLIGAMLLADLQFLYPDASKAIRDDGIGALSRLTLRSLWPDTMSEALASPEIRYSIKLSLITCSVSTVLSMIVGVPLGYLLARTRFVGKTFVDAVLDIPIVLPPLVLGLSLLILFQTAPGLWFERGAQHWGGDLTFSAAMLAGVLLSAWLAARLWRLFWADRRLVAIGYALGLVVVLAMVAGVQSRRDWIDDLFARGITYQIPSVVLAQFAVSCAFAARTMRVTFEQINPRTESVAMTLGCTRAGAFWRVSLPQARRGMLTAASIAWARALGEFGPILIFAGATRMRTEVLPTTVFLELSIGNIEAAVAVSMIMIVAALSVLLLLRTFGIRGSGTV